MANSTPPAAASPTASGTGKETGALQVTPVTPSLGAVVSGVDLSQPLTDELIAGIRSAWLEHQVLFFRDQDITLDQHRDCSMYAAYDALSDHWKRFIDPLDARHSAAARHGGEFGIGNVEHPENVHPHTRRGFRFTVKGDRPSRSLQLAGGHQRSEAPSAWATSAAR